MKYFTQDLIVRGQSRDDKVLNQVEALWDEHCARYAAYLDSVRDRLPPGLRHRIDSYYLHDAAIRGTTLSHPAARFEGSFRCRRLAREPSLRILKL